MDAEQERQPLVTLAEAREAVELLALFGQGDSDEARRAGQLASDIARRLPSVEDNPSDQGGP
ncbi:hypothetical protein [Streptomyces candidus]|uniref:hypothetical protein n=1 Tax=Streptomyces candidus TaxID=67283 RepID=UPI001678FE1B|nr:hypothetical protein [Streptomyces candidus]